jgi:predicted phage terminase large subunit-like protein
MSPEFIAELKVKVAEYSRRVNREKQSKRGGLIEFVRYFWHVLEPQTPMVEGWAMESICTHLEAVTFGEINRLLITVPPGFSKSLMTSCFWPLWEQSAMGLAHMRYVCFSYSASLTERDNTRFRDLAMSPEFLELWGDAFTLVKTGETQISNNKTGWKLASSVGGVGTGQRGNRVILDDPHSIKQAESELIRTETTRWFREAMSNRLNDMAADAIVVIMQRSHDEDVAGVIIGGDFDYCVLSIEMELDTSRETFGAPNDIGWIDPRTIDEDNKPLSPEECDGVLAWPERFPRSVCEQTKVVIGPFAWAAQYQQSPTSRSGGILKRLWWCLWDGEEAQKYGLEWNDRKGALKEFPHMELIVGSIDTAYGAKQENDYTAMTVFGVWLDQSKNRRAMLMFAWAKRLPLHGITVDAFPGEAKVNYEARKQDQWGIVEWVAHTCKRYKIQRLLIEDKTKGRDVSDELRRLYARENWGVELINPVKDKVSRAHAVVPLLADGSVWAPQTNWSETVLDQCARFPKAKNDDLTDCVTQFLNWARANEILVRGDEMSAAMDDEMSNFRHQESVAESYGVLH